MKLRDFLKPVSAIVGVIFPPIGAAIALVNPFLSNKDKLLPDATKEMILEKVDGLPPDLKAQVLNSEVTLEIAREENYTERYKAMCLADDQSSRAFIAKMMGIVVASVDGAVGLAYTVAIFKASEPLVALGSTWPVLTAILAVPAVLLKSYFGILAKEQGQRLGVQTSPLAGLVNLFRGK